MGVTCKEHDHVGDAMRDIQARIQQHPELNILGADVGAHLNPGDVYDAYVDTGRTAVIENMLGPNECGPFAAVYLQQNPGANEGDWWTYVEKTYHPHYVHGFLDGFSLRVPDATSVADGTTSGSAYETAYSDDVDVFYLRGVYDGVMANGAVF